MPVRNFGKAAVDRADTRQRLWKAESWFPEAGVLYVVSQVPLAVTGLDCPGRTGWILTIVATPETFGADSGWVVAGLSAVADGRKSGCAIPATLVGGAKSSWASLRARRCLVTPRVPDLLLL